ncbi:hypothetical protein LU298_11455 [Komagataeibacter intermedius]|uniref:Uncharacterized protein n=2 Tax=Komagataeibacter intermedius TaxID=66229 RepID=A0A0N0MEJ3_9PROT|nr:hypothetical protein [Komagataeibacter intermedius]KPH86513.1 hypothetical protein GLUCOINTEAF2_0202717 [Komagataeibacter intermedius AF2]MCF3637109.1 hypothetical protein [Komagataeibacter intermedius]GAN88048.1 hypothetical protein Gain_0127_014 [Komagataeibacter intermedius TF2]
MAKYKVLTKSYIGGKVEEPGAIIQYDGNPGSNLEPLDAAAEKKMAEYQKQVGQRISASDPRFIAAMIDRQGQ